MTVSMPRRRVENRIVLYKFSDYLNKDDEFIKNNKSNSLIYVDNFELLKNNFDFFLKLIKNFYFDLVYANSYEVLEFIEENLNEKTNLRMGLVDDFLNVDRSIIKPNFFKKTTLVLPLVYVLWGIEFDEKLDISLYNSEVLKLSASLIPFNSQANKFILRENVEKIKEIIKKLYEKAKGCNDIEKLLIISDYIQSLTQYVDENNVSLAEDGTYLTDSGDYPVDEASVHSAETVLFHNYGICEAISNATMLLANNPWFNLNVRSLRGSGHVWNVVLIGDKYYYVDNTWGITRNSSRYEESLKAKEFCSDYFLFGQDSALNMGHHVANCLCPVVSKDDYSKDEVEKLVRKVVPKRVYPEPVFPSVKL